VKQRSSARGWGLRLLYSREAPGAAGRPKTAFREFTYGRRIAESSRAYLDELIRIIDEHRGDIDDALQHALTNWRLERLSAIDRNILRIGAAEILYLEDVPARVSIQEAIVLAEKYGTRESPRFVNGVLDALMRQAAGA
jgi:transcription antitermination protein NusB